MSAGSFCRSPSIVITRSPVDCFEPGVEGCRLAVVAVEVKDFDPAVLRGQAIEDLGTPSVLPSSINSN